MMDKNIPGMSWIEHNGWGWISNQKDIDRTVASEKFIRDNRDVLTARIEHAVIRQLEITSIAELEILGERRARGLSGIGNKSIRELKDAFGIWGSPAKPWLAMEAGKTGLSPKREVMFEESLASFLRACGWTCTSPLKSNEP